MKNLIRYILLSASLIFTITGNAADVDVNANDDNIAIKGYDTVAYFTQSKAVKGKIRYSATYKNTSYYFSTQENRSLFVNNPTAYAPQYGGYCAFGVTKEKKFDTDPNAWKVVDGKLYLNLDKKVQKIWIKNTTENINEAGNIWPKIKNVEVNKL